MMPSYPALRGAISTLAALLPDSDHWIDGPTAEVAGRYIGLLEAHGVKVPRIVPHRDVLVFVWPDEGRTCLAVSDEGADFFRPRFQAGKTEDFAFDPQDEAAWQNLPRAA